MEMVLVKLLHIATLYQVSLSRLEVTAIHNNRIHAVPTAVGS